MTEGNKPAPCVRGTAQPSTLLHWAAAPDGRLHFIRRRLPVDQHRVHAQAKAVEAQGAAAAARAGGGRRRRALQLGVPAAGRGGAAGAPMLMDRGGEHAQGRGGAAAVGETGTGLRLLPQARRLAPAGAHPLQVRCDTSTVTQTACERTAASGACIAALALSLRAQAPSRSERVGGVLAMRHERRSKEGPRCRRPPVGHAVPPPSTACRFSLLLSGGRQPRQHRQLGHCSVSHQRQRVCAPASAGSPARLPACCCRPPPAAGAQIDRCHRSVVRATIQHARLAQCCVSLLAAALITCGQSSAAEFTRGCCTARGSRCFEGRVAHSGNKQGGRALGKTKQVDKQAGGERRHEREKLARGGRRRPLPKREDCASLAALSRRRRAPAAGSLPSSKAGAASWKPAGAGWQEIRANGCRPAGRRLT